MATQRNGFLVLKAKLFRGLADPSRLGILESLRGGAKTVSEIVSATTLSQPNVSGHLACLRDCGLVTSRQEGRSVFYALSDPLLEDLLRSAESFLSHAGEEIYACTRYDADKDYDRHHSLERPPRAIIDGPR